MDMPWSALRSLRELARWGTVAAAAEAQGYTAGAVSQQLAVLERAAGTPLLERVGRRVQLTQAGHVLVEHAGRILRAEEEARTALEATGDEIAGSLTVATFASFAASLLAPSIVEATRRHPRLRIRTLEMHPDEVATAVERGDADIAFGLEYRDAPLPQATGVQFARIASEAFMVGSAAAMLPPTPGALRLEQLADKPWIVPPENTQYGRAVFAACRRAGFEPRVVHVVNDTATSLAMAAHGLGITTVTPMMLTLIPAPELVCHDLLDDLRRDLILIQRRGSQRRPAVAAVTQIIGDIVADFTARAALASPSS